MDGFLRYMFWPDGAPWYTGAFWSNQVQWTVVTLPTVVWAWWKLERSHRKRHEELRRDLGLDQSKASEDLQ